MSTRFLIVRDTTGSSRASARRSTLRQPLSFVVSRERQMSASRSGRRFVSLRGKFLWGTVLIITIVMGAVMAIVEHRQRVAIIREIQRRGTISARSLAAMSTDAFLIYNFTALEQNVARMAEEEDVEYAIIFDLERRVVAHSERPDLVGAVLTDRVSSDASRAEALAK